MAKSYKTLVFRIEALTNLHPGAGDSFYGAVDKMVQRDAATNRPAIFSHSLKGALREYFEEEVILDAKVVNRIFGTPVKGKSEDARPGAYRFFSADLVALPIPEENPDSTVAFHLATDPKDIKRTFNRLNLMGVKTWAGEAEFKTAISADIKSDDTFAKRFREAAESLPVVARNCLDNGKSENLWYEELIPSHSIFIVAVQSGQTKDNDIDTTKTDEDTFIKHITDPGKIIQIGANATVGYGYCRFTLLNPGK